MRRLAEKAAWALVGAAITAGVALTYGIATGQEGEAPPPPQPPPQMVRPVQGTVVRLDIENSGVLVRTPRGEQWVHVPPGTGISKQVTAQKGDIKERDVLTVIGVPTQISALNLEIDAPRPPNQAGNEPQPGGGAQGGPARRPFGPMGMAGGSFGRVTGTVTKLDPLTLTMDDLPKTTVVVTVNDRTRLVRRMEVGVKDIKLGEQFLAFGQMGENEVMEAETASVGDMAQMGGMFGGMMGGGPGGRRGPRGGGGAQPNRQGDP